MCAMDSQPVADNVLARTFFSPEFGRIRTEKIDGVAWFSGKDVASALGYRGSCSVILRVVSEEDRIKRHGPPMFGIHEVWFINESGMHALISWCKWPTGRRFEEWITAEVLPTIHNRQISEAAGQIPAEDKPGRVKTAEQPTTTATSAEPMAEATENAVPLTVGDRDRIQARLDSILREIVLLKEELRK